MDARYPIGQFSYDTDITPQKRAAWTNEIAALPLQMRSMVALLPASRLDTPYREGGWTVRQVVHHVADSHLNAYVRFKLALTEDTPTVRTYEEGAWAELADGKHADPQVSLSLLDAVHQRLVMVLTSLGEADFARPATHPSWGPISVDWLLQMYAWHGRHHLAHVSRVVRG